MAFAEVLADKLGSHGTTAPVPPGPAFGHAPTVNTFFDAFGRAARPAIDPRGWRLYSVAGGAVNEAPRRPVQVRRALSSRERAALDQLNALGGCVDAGFTLDELRSAFRSLARTYHPDRHPGSTASETARLSTAFVTLHDAYRELQHAAQAA